MFRLVKRISLKRSSKSSPKPGAGYGLLTLALMILLASSGTVSAASSDIIWSRDFGGNGEETGNMVRPCSDGGYIVAGSSRSGGGSQDFYLVKTNSQGDKLWERTFGGAGEEQAKWVEQSTDGGYVLAGSIKAVDSGILSIYIIKTDPTGKIVWDKTLGETRSAEALAMHKNWDGSFVVTGYMQSVSGIPQAYLMKIDNAGKVKWENSFASANIEKLQGIYQSSDGGYILTGYSQAPASNRRDLLLMKTDVNGDLKWRKSFANNNLQGGQSVIPTADGGFLIAGYRSQAGSSGNGIYLLKTDGNGTYLWDKSYSPANDSSGCAVYQMPDYTYVVLANTQSNISGVLGGYLLKTDSKGNKTGDLSMGIAGPESVSYGQLTSDGYYILVGTKMVANAGKNLWLGKVKLQNPATAAAPVISKGSFIWPDQSEYRGDMQNGKANGWGKVTFSDGGIYEGAWKDNLFNGQGTLITPDGSTYKGGFKDNMYWGKGVYTWSTGEKYEGAFRYNKRNGEGEFSWSNGVKYTGDWLDNSPHGYGNIQWPNRENYVGEMKDGEASGLGTYIFANGEKYVGQFSSLVFDGFGTYTWKNGASYTGEFKQDMMNGQGTYTWPNGIQQWGFWRDDKYIGLYQEGFSKKDK